MRRSGPVRLGQEAEVSHAPAAVRGLGEVLGFLAVAGDKAYQSAALSAQALEELMEPVIASRKLKGQDAYPESARGFDRLLYKGRNVVERLIGRLKEMRRIATRYDKLASSYLAFIYLGFIRIWLREL